MEPDQSQDHRITFIAHFVTFIFLFVAGNVLSRAVLEPMLQPLASEFFSTQLRKMDEKRVHRVAVADISRSRKFQTIEDQGDVLAMHPDRIRRLFKALKELPANQRPSAIAFDFDISNNFVVIDAEGGEDEPSLVLDSPIDTQRHADFIKLCSEFSGDTGIPIRYGVGILGFMRAEEFYIGDGADSYAAAVFLPDDVSRQPLLYRRDLGGGESHLKTLGVAIAQADCVRRENAQCDFPANTEEYLDVFRSAGLKVVHDPIGLDGRGLYIGIKPLDNK